MTRNDRVALVEKMLADNDRGYYEVYGYGDLPVVCVEIHWGDWKHDHACCDWLVKEKLGGTLIKADVTEEDGSDTYSAIRYYFVDDEIELVP